MRADVQMPDEVRLLAPRASSATLLSNLSKVAWSRLQFLAMLRAGRKLGACASSVAVLMRAAPATQIWPQVALAAASVSQTELAVP